MKFSCVRGFAHPRGCSRRLAPSPKTPFPIPASRFVVFPILTHVLMPVPALFVSTNIKCQIGMTFALGDARVNASNSLPSPPSRCSLAFTQWNVCVSVCILNTEFWYCGLMLYLSHDFYYEFRIIAKKIYWNVNGVYSIRCWVLVHFCLLTWDLNVSFFSCLLKFGRNFYGGCWDMERAERPGWTLT